MNALEVHSLIGAIFTLVLLTVTVIAFLAVVITMAIYYIDGPQDRALDVVGSQYLSADGKRYDWSKGDLPQGRQGAPRARINTPAFQHIPLTGPDDDEEESEEPTADDTPEDEGTDTTIEFDIPDYAALSAAKPPKILRPR